MSNTRGKGQRIAACAGQLCVRWRLVNYIDQPPPSLHAGDIGAALRPDASQRLCLEWTAHGVPVPGGSSSDLEKLTGSGYTDIWYDVESRRMAGGAER